MTAIPSTSLDPQVHLFTQLSKQIHQDSRSIKNRIQSIIEDSNYIQLVSQAFGLPLVANERCGRWYIPNRLIHESVYFKSTDGHTGHWSFNTRRLNLHILKSIRANNGCLIIDSTRRGKRMPDSFSKTIPIWCAVINCLAFDTTANLYTPPNCVSASEHDQIKCRIGQWVDEATQVKVDIEFIKMYLDKPLHPIWVTPDSTLPDNRPEYDGFYPVVLCTASRMAQDGTELRQGYTYVQGAADDHELWARNLYPQLLWAHIDELGQLKGDEELLALVDQFADSAGNSRTKASFDIIRLVPTNIWLTNSRPVSTDHQTVIDLTEKTESEPEQPPDYSYSIIRCPLTAGKKGAKDLRIKLPSIINALGSPPSGVLIVDPNYDFSIGVALAIMCLFYSLDNQPLDKRTTTNLTKQVIRSKLGSIVLQTKVNPSRATLNSVNAFLMG